MDLFEDVPFDQIIALSCQGFSLVAAILYYHILHPKGTSIITRHLVSASIGVVILLLCYGWDSLHLFLLCLLSYILMLYLPVHQRGWMMFGACIAHVMTVHLHTYIYHYMEFRVEISGSLMVLAIKISYTAYSLDDHHTQKRELTARQAKYKLEEMPSFFEYFSFCFCFLGILFGPAYHFKDYMSFIRGDQYRTSWPVAKAVSTLLTSLICLITHYLLTDSYSASYNISPAVMSLPLIQRHIILWFTMMAARCKYYFGWLSSEAACYFCGMGYDPDERTEWGSTVATVNILGIEFATSLKVFSDCWNIFTTRWLHFCVYERAKRFKVLWVFLFSATWHGFYPGYYMMFAPLALAILLGRKLRRTLRPAFQGSTSSQRIYDIITWIATTTLIAFNSCAFELKEWKLIYSLQRSFYFWPHVAVVLGLVLVPSGTNKVQTNGYRDSGMKTREHHQYNHQTNGVHKLHAG